MEISTGYLIFFILVAVPIVLAVPAIIYRHARDSAKRKEATETKKSDRTKGDGLLRKATSLLLLQGMGAILGTAAIMLVVIVVFISYLPTWRLGYDAAGGGAWWVILFVTVAMVAVAVLVKGRILRGMLLTPLILLLFFTILIPLTSGFINRPACLEDDLACHKAVALAEAEEEAAELAEINRRAAYFAAVEKAKNTSDSCPGETEVVELEGDLTVTVNPGGRCIIEWDYFDGFLEVIDTNGKTLTLRSEDVVESFWTEQVRSANGKYLALHYRLLD